MTLGRRLRPLALALVAAGVVALAAVPALAAEIDVQIIQKTFSPAQLTVTAGDTVVWTVTDGIGEPHSVKSGKVADANAGSLFDSGIEGLKENGESFEFRFETPGTVDYFCIVHPEMIAQVVVTAASDGEGGEGIPVERKLIGAGILVATLIVGFGAAWVWRRMNPAT